MGNEKMYKIYYGENENDYIGEYLKESDIINGYLSEAKAFDLFYSAMIMCNDYLKECYTLDVFTSAYNDEEDYDIEEYQFFIIDPAFDEEITKKATEKMGNTLYYDYKKELYITGITDLGTSRTIVPTDIKVKEVEE